jgi:hypothetical protein
MEESDLAVAVPEMQRLTRELMPMLLQGNDPRLEILRAQWQAAALSISNASSCGFYADILVPPKAPRVDAPSQGGGNATIPVQGYDQPAGCILYVVDGALQFLEVYNVIAWDRPPVFERPTHVEPFVFKAPVGAAGHGA